MDDHDDRGLLPAAASGLSEALIEHGFACPYCGEPITMLLELTLSHQSYVEDCEICCNPILLRFSARDGELTEFDADQLV